MALDFTRIQAAQARLAAAVTRIEDALAAAVAANDPAVEQAQQAQLDTVADGLNGKAAEVEAKLPAVAAEG